MIGKEKTSQNERKEEFGEHFHVTTAGRGKQRSIATRKIILAGKIDSYPSF